MKGISGSGNISGNVAVFSGPLRKIKDRPPRKPGKDESALMLSKIDHLYIGLSPLGPKVLHNFTHSIEKIRAKLPTFLVAKRWVHACVFLATTKLSDTNYDGILIEYGAYVEDTDTYEHEIFYLEKDGLRFTEMTLDEFKTRMENENKGTENVPYVKCIVHSVNFFHQLIERAIFGEEYAKNPANNFYQLFIGNEKLEDKFKNTYRGKNYDLIRYNCQCFVAKILEASYATLVPVIEYKIVGLFIGFREKKIDYDYLKLNVPPNIVDALEKNKNIIDQRIKEGKSPIVENNIASFYDFDNFMNTMDQLAKDLNLEQKK